MQVVFHMGAPCTDDDRLIRSLLKNREPLAKQGIAVPTPALYRDVLKDTLRALDGAPAPAELQRNILTSAKIPEGTERIIFSDPRMVSINRLVVIGAQIWPMIDRVSRSLRNLFPTAEVEFMLGMRDPATLIPALFRGSRFRQFEEFTEDMQPHALAWSEMLARMRVAVPDCPVSAWCNEDTPLIWGEVMRELAGCDPLAPLDGVDDLIEDLMDPAGFRRMQRYLSENPPENEMLRRRVVAAFLDKYALDDALEEDLDTPGWSAEMLDDMTASYEEDMDAVAHIPGVTLITP
ncbi:hypothetical protein [Nioella sediminis]|jgi:hypothetical protein|uniref:hypothetical protein n=1 Tax=Nioella sediminis TaxID=1912092 RepID=UPI0008FD94D3|nr:hypothetical protein [Nioella sediminis]TBX27793.1 hypothetical protein TK43_09135 [Roseovarius sp. JS7-11]